MGLQIIAFFCINPYLIALADWRDFMTEESEALMHASVETNKALKSCLTLALLFLISITTFGILNICIDGYESWNYFVAMLFDSASLTLPFICFGLYTPLPLQFVQVRSCLSGESQNDVLRRRCWGTTMGSTSISVIEVFAAKADTVSNAVIAILARCRSSPVFPSSL